MADITEDQIQSPLLSVEQGDFDPFVLLNEARDRGETGPVPVTQVEKKKDEEKVPLEKGDVSISDDEFFKLQDEVLSKKPKPAATSKPEDNPGEPEKPPVEQSTEDIVAKNMYDDWVERGLIEPDEEFDGTVESFVAVAEKNDQIRAEKIANDWFTEIFEGDSLEKEKAKSLFDHLKKGGRVDDFINVYSGDSVNATLLESTDEDQAEMAAKTMLRTYYSKVVGWDNETLDAQFARWEKLGSFVDEAKVIKNPYEKYTEKAKTEMTTKTTQQIKNQREQGMKLNTDISELIEKNESFAGFAIGKTKAEKDKVQSYFFKPVVKLENGQTVPQFYADQIKMRTDPEWILYQALSVLNDKKPGKLVEKAETAAVIGIREKIREQIKSKAVAGGESVDQSRKVESKNPLGIDWDNPRGTMM